MSRPLGPVLFTGSESDPATLSEVIGEGAGAVSVCWSTMRGAGEFDSERASAVVDEMVAWIHKHYVARINLEEDSA